MYKFITLLLLALFATGCVEDDCQEKYGCYPDGLPAEQRDGYSVDHLKSTLTISSELTAKEVEAVMAAADSWRVATNGRIDVQFVIADGELPARFVVRRARPGELLQGMLAATQGTHIKLGADMGSSPYLLPALVHEFGHYFGLGHEPNLVDDIMYPNTHEGMPTAPTSDALHDLAEVYEW